MKFVVVNSNTDTILDFRSTFAEVSLTCQKRASLHCFEGSLGQYVDSLESISLERVAVLSPANSLCFMGGGFDRAIAELFTGPNEDYRAFEAMVQNHALSIFNGFMPPQAINVIDLKELFAVSGKYFPIDSKITHLIQTPTMAVPEKSTVNTVFYCMWNMLLAVDNKLDTIILPAIGAGYGGVPPKIVARTIGGALGLYYMDINQMNRGAAVLLFLNKDYRAFGDPIDIARIESTISEWGKNEIQHENIPLDWPVLCRCLETPN